MGLAVPVVGMMEGNRGGVAAELIGKHKPRVEPQWWRFKPFCSRQLPHRRYNAAAHERGLPIMSDECVMCEKK